MSLSNHREKKILEEIIAGELFVKLHVGDPGEDCTGNPATETDRVAASFGAPSEGAVLNDEAIEWPEVAADEKYTHASIWDHPTAGNPEGSGAIENPQDIKTGNDFRIKIGKLKIAIN